MGKISIVVVVTIIIIFNRYVKNIYSYSEIQKDTYTRELVHRAIIMVRQLAL